ncbi:MAG: beta-ketoacyl-ACP synthase III [Clostridia bacterium]
MRRAVVAGLGTYLPETRLTNQDLERFMDTSDEWIVSRTGIRERRLAGPGETASSMGAEASRRALAAAAIGAEQLDWVICATNTGDTVFPATSTRILNRLGPVQAAAFDVQAGCTGFIYGLALATSLIESGVAARILVVGTDVLSSIVDWEDRSTAVLFGDGAGAIVLEAGEGSRGVLASYLNADGTGGPLLMMPAGGSAMPASPASLARRQHYLKMSGNDVFRFAVKALPDAVEAVLRRAELSAQDLDLLVPHQANLRIIDAASKRFGLTADQVVVNIDRLGNTSVASIPLALQEAVQDGRAADDRIVVMAAFGAGLTWGATAVRWGR